MRSRFFHYPDTNGKVAVVYALLLVWTGFIAWQMAWPLSWSSAVILCCWLYLFFRLVFEVTLNRKNIPTMATTMSFRRLVAKTIKEDANHRAVIPYIFYDLGSGRGELVRRVGRDVARATVIGIEKAKVPTWQAKVLHRVWGTKNVTYKCTDFWDYDFSDASAVFVYLTPTATERAGKKLQQELKEGALVILHMYALGESWQPVDVLELTFPLRGKLYVYRKT